MKKTGPVVHTEASLAAAIGQLRAEARAARRQRRILLFAVVMLCAIPAAFAAPTIRGAVLQFASAEFADFLSGSGIKFAGKLAFSGTAPIITSACTTAPSVTHGTVTSFLMDVGTGCTGDSTIVLSLPAATNGWTCHAESPSITRNIKQLAPGTTTSVTLTNVSETLGTAADFNDGDDVPIRCAGR